jgi:hypothetical protein
MEKRCNFFYVGAESLDFIQMSFGFKGLHYYVSDFLETIEHCAHTVYITWMFYGYL